MPPSWLHSLAMSQTARRLAITLCLAFGPGLGSAHPAEKALGLGLGFADPNDFQRHGLYLTACIRIGLTPLLVVEPEVGFWRAAWNDGPFGGSRRDLSGSVHLIARTPSGPVRLWGGGGVGVHSVHNEFRYPYAPYQLSFDNSKFGIHALVGLDVSLTRRLWLFGAGRYDLLEGEAQNELKAYAGLRWQI